MLNRLCVPPLAVALSIPAFSTAVFAQHPANANAVYQQLRGLLPGGEVIAVKDLELKRDAATLTFREGNIAFYGQVDGKITGAVFRGEGHFHLSPPNAQERHSLMITTQSEEFDEDFDRAVLRFTDATADELHKASTAAGQPSGEYAQTALDLHNFMRTKLRSNMDLRILEDVLSPAAGGYFVAAIHGKKNPHLLFTIDPHGDGEFAPEEVTMLIYNDWGPSWPAAFHWAKDEAHGGANNNEHNAPFTVPSVDLDVSIEKSGFLTGLATVQIRAEQDGVAVVPLNLYPTLRVSKVESDKGDALDYIQEKKDEDADFGVVLAAPLKKGESATVKVTYGGKDVVQNEGNSNYYPIARESWYPNAAQGFGNYATYHMVFHFPKGLQLIATGTRVRQDTDGKITTAEWKSDVALPVAGFNLGDFTLKEGGLTYKNGDKLTVDAYANTNPPDMFTAIAEAVNNASSSSSVADNAPAGAIGRINTVSMLPVELSESQVAAQIYTNYFGALPFSHIAVTQQFACNYGQSWPMLVYLPICGYLDNTQQHVLGLHPEDFYWKMVTPHEVAHQWWGHTVGFRSYRDQWMSEGFADESASLFLLHTRPKPNDYLDFWKEERRLITERNSMGFRPIDVGPVTMGYRLDSQKTGFSVARSLIYPKGAFILHMIQMMMWNPRDGDAPFAEMMHDFVASYRLQPATTEDFKAIVEKHMSPQMNLQGNGKMDWFFNEYVYGTELPAYHFEHQITENGDAQTLHIKLVQSGVSKDFTMPVPLYLELADGRIVRWVSAKITGSSTVDQTVPLPKTPSPVKRVLINHNYDVLCTEN